MQIRKELVKTIEMSSNIVTNSCRITLKLIFEKRSGKKTEDRLELKKLEMSGISMWIIEKLKDERKSRLDAALRPTRQKKLSGTCH